MANAQVAKLTITLGKRNMEFTMEEARALKKLLNDTLEPKVTIEHPIRERVIEKEVPMPLPWRDPWLSPQYRGIEITCAVEQRANAADRLHSLLEARS